MIGMPPPRGRRNTICVYMRKSRLNSGSNYAPAVGDHFYKALNKYRNPLTGEIREYPESHAEVVAVSQEIVLVKIDAVEKSIDRSDFVLLAKKSLANGAVLKRGGAE